jgi:hypothetical protein
LTTATPEKPKTAGYTLGAQTEDSSVFHKNAWTMDVNIVNICVCPFYNGAYTERWIFFQERRVFFIHINLRGVESKQIVLPETFYNPAVVLYP